MEKHFVRQEKAKLLKKTPEKPRVASISASKARRERGEQSAVQAAEATPVSSGANALNSRRGGKQNSNSNLEDVIIVLHRQLHNLKI